MTSRVQVKITIAKLLEIAYSKDKGVTTKIVRSKGNFKITIDKNGNVMLYGGTDVLTFSGDSALKNLGVKIKNVSISFSKEESNEVKYVATFVFSGAANISLTGAFNIEELITSCPGLLCKAAKLLKERNQAYDAELQKIMGH